MAENCTPKKHVNCNKQHVFGVLAIVEILRYHGFPIPESGTLSQPARNTIPASMTQGNKNWRKFCSVHFYASPLFCSHRWTIQPQEVQLMNIPPRNFLLKRRGHLHRTCSKVVVSRKYLPFRFPFLDAVAFLASIPCSV